MLAFEIINHLETALKLKKMRISKNSTLEMLFSDQDFPLTKKRYLSIEGAERKLKLDDLINLCNYYEVKIGDILVLNKDYQHYNTLLETV